MFRVGRDLCGSSSPTPCQSRVTYSRLHRTLSRQVLNISREKESTTSLGNLFQGSVTLRVKKFFLMFRQNFLCFSLCPLPLVLLLGTTEKFDPILLTPTLKIIIGIYKVPSQPSLLQAEQAQLPQPFLIGERNTSVPQFECSLKPSIRCFPQTLSCEAGAMYEQSSWKYTTNCLPIYGIKPQTADGSRRALFFSKLKIPS